MAASQRSIDEGPAAIALEMSDSMEHSAREGDWERVGEIMAMLRDAVLQVPETDRRRIILSAHRSLEKVQAIAESARGDVREKLSQIRLGKDMTAAYGGRD
jgi:hypothetical protein